MRYLELASDDNSIKTVDANQEIDKVHRDITNVLRTFFEELK